MAVIGPEVRGSGGTGNRRGRTGRPPPGRAAKRRVGPAGQPPPSLAGLPAGPGLALRGPTRSRPSSTTAHSRGAVRSPAGGAVPAMADRRTTALAASLWDLKGWAGRAEALLGGLRRRRTPAHRFMTAAAIVRHLQTDPLLPALSSPPVAGAPAAAGLRRLRARARRAVPAGTAPARLTPPGAIPAARPRRGAERPGCRHAGSDSARCCARPPSPADRARLTQAGSRTPSLHHGQRTPDGPTPMMTSRSRSPS